MILKVLVAALVGAAVIQGPQPRPLEPFKGVTADGSVVPGLFAVRSTGVSTALGYRAVVITPASASTPQSPVILTEFDHQSPVALAGRTATTTARTFCGSTMRNTDMTTRTAIVTSAAALLLSAGLAAQQPALPQPVEGTFVIRDFRFASGGTLPELKLHYRTLGTLRKDAQGRATNAVLIVHGTTGSGAQFSSRAFAGELFLPGQPLDITKYFIVMPDAIGHGASSKPSDGLRATFPRYGYDDMVDAQHRLLTEGLGVNHARLVMGTSMGGMHTWVWGQRYPDFMDALLPLASLPDQISGRNRAWRRVLIDAIRNDPEWQGGNYTTPPQSMRTAAQMLWLVGSNPVRRQNEAPTLGGADTVLDDYVRGYRGDANNVLYAVEASHDYDPAPGLGKIRAPLVAINFADDLINPPELGILERGTARVAHGCAITIPAGDRTAGHGTHTLAAVWKHHLVQLLEASETPGGTLSCP